MTGRSRANGEIRVSSYYGQTYEVTRSFAMMQEVPYIRSHDRAMLRMPAAEGHRILHHFREPSEPACGHAEGGGVQYVPAYEEPGAVLGAAIVARLSGDGVGE